MATMEPHCLQWFLPWFTTSRIRYLGAALGSVPGLTAHDHANLSSIKAVCSISLGAWPHQPAAHRAPTAFLSKRWKATFPARTVNCQTSLQALQRLTLAIQDPIPRRVNNFMQTYHLLSQISYFLTLKMSVSPLSDQFLCLYSSPTHGEKFRVVNGALCPC